MKKTMCYILQKRTWSDFDIERLEPVLVSLDKDFILYQVMSKKYKSFSLKRSRAKRNTFGQQWNLMHK